MTASHSLLLAVARCCASHFGPRAVSARIEIIRVCTYIRLQLYAGAHTADCTHASKGCCIAYHEAGGRCNRSAGAASKSHGFHVQHDIAHIACLYRETRGAPKAAYPTLIAREHSRMAAVGSAHPDLWSTCSCQNVIVALPPMSTWTQAPD